MPRRIVLDTDIGTDVDDALALALALASPELELVAVTTVAGDTALRARIAARLLALAGRADIPAHAGCAHALSSPGGFAWFGHEGDGILDGSRDSVAEEPAVDALLRLFRAADDLELVAIGPLTNVAVALERDPTFARRVARLTVMGGWLRGARSAARCCRRRWTTTCAPTPWRPGASCPPASRRASSPPMRPCRSGSPAPT